MIATLLGRKLGMTQVWSDDDKLVPVTVIEAGPCVVSQVKTVKRDGYSAAQIAFGDIKPKKVNRPTAGHFAKAGLDPRAHMMEIRLDEGDSVKVGDTFTVEMFDPGTRVSVGGTSKGKGFQGVIKRHGFHGGPGGHGSHFHRQPGSIGACATPSRVYRGSKMAGQMGNATATIRNLEVVKIDAEQNLLLVKGAVPGGKGSLLTIRHMQPQAG
ncbi:MAG: 50S ribosomal protein L3 [Coriobacteriia bacterium]|nr:50S ribosomal protein L3 [Coriobacteriia bacterium]